MAEEERIPPQAIPGPEGQPVPLRSEIQQSRLYPMEEEFFVDLLGIIEIGEDGDTSELEQVLLEAIAFKEGLVYGAENYDLDNKDVLLKLQNDFTTVEESTSRPSIYYLTPAIRKATRGRVQEMKFYRKNPELWEKTKKARYARLSDEDQEQMVVAEKAILNRVGQAENRLMHLENHIDARRVLDEAFLQRMGTCENPPHGAELLEKDRRYQMPTTPDKGHWEALFQGEFGEKVNEVLREIVRVAYSEDGYARDGVEVVPGIPQTVYADGFEETEHFENWIKHMYQVSGERMDVVWTAWRVALTWEIPNQFGKKIDSRGRYVLAIPPVGNALFTWTTHLEEKRALEFGLDSEGRRYQTEKYVSHSGLPMSLGKFPPLCESFLHNTTVGEGENEISFFDMWWAEGKDEDGVKLGDLPWTKTEHLDPGITPGELAPGSFGGWLLKRLRAWSVAGDIRSRPPLGGADGLGNPDYFEKRLRNWGKVIGKVREDLEPEDNPRAWWVAGLILYRMGGIGHLKVPATKGDEKADYHTTQKSQYIEYVAEGLEDRGIAIGDIFNHATNCGFLREKDVKWIKKQLDLKYFAA